MKEETIITTFSRLIESTFIKYKGCLIEKQGNGFKALGECFDNLEDAKKKIDGAFVNLEKTIK